MNDLMLFSLIGAIVLAPSVAAFFIGVRVGRRRAAWGDQSSATLYTAAGADTMGYPSEFARTAIGTADDESPDGFRPTQVMSYADAMNAAPGQADESPTLGTPGSSAPATVGSTPDAAPAIRNRRKVDARIRIRLMTGPGTDPSAPATSFETIDVVGISLEGGLPMIHARFTASPAAAGGEPGVVRIPAARIVSAVDLVGRARIDDLWLWLEARAARPATARVATGDVVPAATVLPGKYEQRRDTVTA